MPATGRAPGIMVVEDEPVLRELLGQLLRMGGCDVVCAETGERALRLMRARRGRIDALFTEVELPGLVDGWIVADEFQACNPGRPVIFASDAAGEIGRRKGAAAVLAKPVSPIDVLAQVKRLVEAPSTAPAPAFAQTAPSASATVAPVTCDGFASECRLAG